MRWALASVLPRLSAIGIAVLLVLAVRGEATEMEVPDGVRVVAIGDVHGSHESLVAALRAAGLVDGNLRWSGGRSILVQTGDLTDRGTEVKDVFDLMMRLQGEADAAGGRVITLFGNHEFYNLVGIISTKSTDPEDLATLVGKFGGKRAEKRQRDLLRRYRAWRERYPGCGAMNDEEWLETHPPGFEEYVEAISPRGEYGKWLRTFATVARVGDTLFVHGGLSPSLEAMGFDTLGEINDRIRDELALYDSGREWLEQNGAHLPGLSVSESLCAVESEIFRRTGGNGEGEDSFPAGAGGGEQDQILEALRYARGTLPSSGWLANHENGPLWFRGYAFWEEEEGEEAIPAVLDRFGGAHVVVGHTPQPGKITPRFGGKAFLIDTAMVFGEAAGGGPAALEIKSGTFFAVYPDRRVVLWDPAAGAHEAGFEGGDEKWLGPGGASLPLHSLSEIEGFLRTATVVADEPIPIGVTKPRRLELERDGVRARAAFRHHHEEERRKKLETRTIMLFRDSWRNEIIAYELSKMLGLGRVPPTVERSVDGVEGSVQLWIEDAMMEVDRRERGIDPPNRLRFQRQVDDMNVFDNLIGNFDRNQGNILLDVDWNAWLIDHTRAFRPFNELVRPDSVVRCSRGLWAGLSELSRAELEERVGAYVKPGDIDALLARRDLIVEKLEKRIREVGESKVLFDWGDPNPYVEVLEEPDVPTGREVGEAGENPRGEAPESP
jgi:hypothetical protein